MATKRLEFSQFYIVPILFIAGLITLVLCIYFFVQYQRANTILTSPTARTNQEGDEIMQVVRPVIHIAHDEKPTLATVADKTKLADQPFFERAENGDKVLIFKTSNTVVLYRPSVKKVIAVSSIPQGEQTTKLTTTQDTVVPLQVAVLNGSQVNGVAKKTAESIVQKVKNITIVKEETAEKKTYTKAQIVYTTPISQAVATQIAELLDGEMTTKLPDGEKGYNADIVVIAIQ